MLDTLALNMRDSVFSVIAVTTDLKCLEKHIFVNLLGVCIVCYCLSVTDTSKNQ